MGAPRMWFGSAFVMLAYNYSEMFVMHFCFVFVSGVVLQDVRFAELHFLACSCMLRMLV